MLEHFVPPEQFRDSTLENYVPDPRYPSQDEARSKAMAFVSGNSAGKAKKLWGRAQRVKPKNCGEVEVKLRLRARESISMGVLGSARLTSSPQCGT